ncbi:hypothetical protein L593_11625 [Salinarchaeum sp. Harcht-Bsk1]|uniref:hypothetical protein n=1 Tax=Salinarchaeum sp. Harcht-Bsk1 TaxID=1333523 RepID=UPI00034237A6|nr:hypothetical protein [Salinarchaeum sp. Harcht-Bsk1]AGN02268.1 hypothetical protein L593_11625 [Salinarchaeum sp. Harcht-Bsk1]
MALDVSTPAPPELEPIDPEEYDDVEVVSDTDYRREEIGDFLEDGAWEESFDTWREDSDMDEDTFAVVEDLGLFEDFDFFWDSFADRVGYHSPGVPENWKERDIHPELDTWERASTINAELAELGQIVCDVLKADYIDWESEYEAPDDLPDY